MRRLIPGAVLVALVAGTVGASLATAGRSAGTAVVKTFAADKMVPNRFIQDGLHFTPGTIRIASGGTLTFTYGDREQEPHTMTIVKRADLPKTAAQAENCTACERYATPHLKNPKAPPGDSNPIVHWTIDKGQAGLDEAGDSVAIQPGAHKQIRIQVSAKPGTTLYFVCAVHPWMQGRIDVT